MTLSAESLCPLISTPAKLDRARRAWREYLEACGRTYVPRKALDLTFPNTPRDGGIENNYPSTAHALMAWFIMDDRLALDQAVAIGKWLWQVRGEWDRAHRQRSPWLSMVARAAMENGAAPSGVDDLVAAFNSDVGRTLNEKYLYSFVGSTTRPLIRTLGAAVMLAEIDAMTWRAESGGLGIVMRDRALSQWKAWADALWKPGVRWGWLGSEDGFWQDTDPAWKRFPFLGGGDPIDAASDDTWFHYGTVIPYEALITEMYAELPPTAETMVRMIARHAIVYGYDPESGRSLKSIGFKKGEDNRGCMAPGFFDKPWRNASDEEKDRFLEMSHFDLAPALFAAGRDKAERREIVVDWGKKCRSVGREGEVPFGALAVVVKLGFGA